MAWTVSRHKVKHKTHFLTTSYFSNILKHPLLRTKIFVESVNRRTELWYALWKSQHFSWSLSNDAQFSKSRVWLMAFCAEKEAFFLLWTFQPFGLPLEFCWHYSRIKVSSGILLIAISSLQLDFAWNWVTHWNWLKEKIWRNHWHKYDFIGRSYGNID